MPVINGTDGHDHIEGTGGADVMVGGTGSDTYVVNHASDLVLEDADATDSTGLPWWGTTAQEPITLIRTAASEYWIRIQVDGAPDGVFAEFRLKEVSPGVLGINGLRVADTAGEMPQAILSETDSVWEYAFQLGRPSEDGSPTEFEWYGGGHGSQQLNSLGLTLDGIDFSALPIGTPVNGASLSVVQDLQVMLPTDRTTPAGAALLQHVFDSSGMSIEHAHSYLEGFVLGRAYSGMMPATGAGEGGIDWMQVGDGPAHRIVYDGASYLEEGRPTYATAWGDDHNFMMRMSLPHGGPDVNGDWSRAEPWGMWLWDTVDYSKIYLNWLEGGASEYPAIGSAHETHYSVSLRDITVPTGVTPLAPRAASQGVDTILSSISLTLPDNIEILRLTGSEDLSGSGNNLNNTLVGNDGANLLDGRGGSDLLFGGAGDDTYLIRAADDYAEERADEGVDTILTFLSSHTLGTHFEHVTYVGSGAFTAVGNAANNRLETGKGADTLRGLGGDDQLWAGDGDDTLLGGVGADLLVGGAGLNLLLGEEGDDTLDSRGGQGTLQGGTGNDIYLIDSRTISIVEIAGEGLDEVRSTLDSFTLGGEVESLTYTGASAFTGVGNELANRLTGGGAGDLLNGLDGDDHLMGLEGSDLLLGGSGANTLDGGSGVDTAYYAGGPGGVTLDLTAGGGVNAHGALDLLIAIENITATSFADQLTGDAAANTLNGGEGDDVIAGRGGADILMGGGGLDTLTYALAASGVTALLHSGQTANDGDGSSDSISGFEHLVGSDFDDTLEGDAAANSLRGGAGADTLSGRQGDDVLEGGAGAANTLIGGLGDDLYVVESDDVIVELTDEGFDTVEARINAYTLSANLETLRFTGVGNFIGRGNAQDNSITGGDGDDVLSGEAGADTLVGLAGDDVLEGGAGAVNVLTGGLGNDLYVVEADDVILELADEGQDTVEARINAYTLSANLETLRFAGEGNFVGRGNAQDNSITGGAGDDVLSGGGGVDILAGGLGIDTVDYSSAAAGVSADLEALSSTDDGDGAADTFNSIENLTGSAFDDVLRGDALANRLAGMDGADTLMGLDGDDVLEGGAGAANTLIGGLGDDLYVVESDDVIVELTDEGSDTVEARINAYTLSANLETLRFTGVGNFIGRGNAQDNSITGGDGDDVLSGEAGADALVGLDGDDVLEGGAGAVNSLTGGLGNDLYVVEADDVIVEAADEGADTVEARINACTLSANVETLRFTGEGDFVGRGNAQDNSITGGDGDDVLSGGGGVDILAGGLGIDTVDYSSAAGAVKAQLNTLRSTQDGDGATDTFSSIENLTGSGFDDLLIGNAQVNVLRGGDGADTLLGLGGDDVLAGGAGALNTLQGGLGDDWYILEAADSVHEFSGEGTDTVEARVNLHVLAVNVENLVFTGAGDFRGTGNASANAITGAAGDDVLRGGGGTDVLDGGAGGDTADYTLAAAGVVARIDFQTSSNDGEGASDIFISIEHLVGSNHADTLVGDGSGNRLSGGLGADLILGGDGDDVLSGGSGALNQLQGGAGNDWYILDAADTCVENAGEGADTVEARIGNYVLRDNIENLIYTGSTKFVGTGNALDNTITGGAQNDILRGMGGNDVIRGGGGVDELQVRGTRADYTITAQGEGWLITDSNAVRDGAIYVESMEVVRFLSGNTTTALTYPPPAPAGSAKAVAAAAGVADDPFVLPGMEGFNGAKGHDPQILPSEEPPVIFLERGPLAPSLDDWMATLDPQGDVWGF